MLPERFLFFPQTDGGTWLGRIGQQILYLQFSSNASLQLQCLHQRDILCLCCAKKLLIEDCCVYYRSNSTVQCLTLPLSQMRRELVTLLLLALLQPQGQPTTAVLPMPSAFGELQELCSYAPAAAVFGRQIGSWNWWRIDEKGFPFRKKGTEAPLCIGSWSMVPLWLPGATPRLPPGICPVDAVVCFLAWSTAL